MIVIIGAGPIGLYLAYKLQTAGVNDLIIFDPRAGEYVRPGHVIPELFTALHQNLHKTVWPAGKHGHIKDIERILFKEITKLGVTVQRQKFIRFNSPDQAQGVVVLDEEGKEHFVPCTYAFDCTGSSRVLINHLNDIITPPPFMQTRVTEKVVVANHCLAYVAMDDPDFYLITKYEDDADCLKRTDLLEYVTSMQRLRGFGWTQFAFPRCYGERFSDGKVCLYLEAPDNLMPQFRESWVQTVLKARTGSDTISFQTVPDPKKYKSKPRLTTFSLNPVRLEQLIFKKDGLPTVIANGDALCDPVYVLAHGIQDGMSWVNTLISYLTINQGTISSFDINGYETKVRPEINSHAQEIVEHYLERFNHFTQYLEFAEIFFKKAVEEAAPDSEQRTAYAAILQEIGLRLDFNDVDNTMRALLGLQKRLTITADTAEETKTKLSELHANVVTILNGLPNHFQSERLQSREYLKQIGEGWNVLANFYYNQHWYYEALITYNKAYEALQDPWFHLPDSEEIIKVQYNIMLCYYYLRMHDELLTFAQKTIEQYSGNTTLLPTNKLIMSLLVKTFHAELANDANNALDHDSIMKKMKISKFIKTHSNLLPESSQKGIKKLCAERRNSVPPQVAKNKPQDRENKENYSPKYFKSGTPHITDPQKMSKPTEVLKPVSATK